MRISILGTSASLIFGFSFSANEVLKQKISELRTRRRFIVHNSWTTNPRKKRFKGRVLLNYPDNVAKKADLPKACDVLRANQIDVDSHTIGISEALKELFHKKYKRIQQNGVLSLSPNPGIFLPLHQLKRFEIENMNGG